MADYQIEVLRRADGMFIARLIDYLDTDPRFYNRHRPYPGKCILISEALEDRQEAIKQVEYWAIMQSLDYKIDPDVEDLPRVHPRNSHEETGISCRVVKYRKGSKH